MRVGVLAMQGAFIEHEKTLQSCGCDVIQVRKKEQLKNLNGLIIPGGESTTIGKLLFEFDLHEDIKKLAADGMPVFGTCAGLIVMAKEIEASNQTRLGLMDITAKRNAFGRQVDSFEAELQIEDIGGEPFKAVFIRAPYISKTGSDIKILSTHQNKIVFARQRNLLVSAFHPELTDDLRIHQYFLQMVEEYKQS